MWVSFSVAMPSKTLEGRFNEQIAFFEKKKREAREVQKSLPKKRKAIEALENRLVPTEEEAKNFRSGKKTCTREHVILHEDLRELEYELSEAEKFVRENLSDHNMIEYLLDVGKVLRKANEECGNARAEDAQEEAYVNIPSTVRGRMNSNATITTFVKRGAGGQGQGGTGGSTLEVGNGHEGGGGEEKGEIFLEFLKASRWHDADILTLNDKQHTTRKKKKSREEVYGVPWCERCDCDRKYFEDDGCLVCMQCGDVEYTLEDGCRNFPVTEQPFMPDYSYKRENHLTELLNHYTGKNSKVPVEVLNRIRDEFRKHRINATDIDQTLVRSHLQRMKLSKYYDCSAYISESLGGKPMIQVDRNTMEKLRVMFKAIQQPYEKAKEMVAGTKGRKNMLHYGFCISKMAQLLGQDELAKAMPMLKSREKLMMAESVWKEICVLLNWQYIPPS